MYTFKHTAEVAADLVAQGLRQSLYLHPGFKGHDLLAEQSSAACFGAGRLNELQASTAVNGMAVSSQDCQASASAPARTCCRTDSRKPK